MERVICPRYLAQNQNGVRYIAQVKSEMKHQYGPRALVYEAQYAPRK